MAYTYLVTDNATGAQQLVEASSPSIAIADVAGDSFTAERVDGGVLILLSKSMAVRKVGKAADPAPTPAPPPSGDNAGVAPPSDNDKPGAPAGKPGK